DRLLWRDRSLYESILFIASILPTADRPLHALRIRAAARGETPQHQRMNAWVRKNARLRRDVIARLRREGPLPLDAFEDRSIDSWTSSGWNADRNVSMMLHFLMRLGVVAIGARASGRRVFTLASTWLPTVRPLSRRLAARLATERALRAMGVATYQQLRRYYGLGYYVTPDALRDLERTGVARRVIGRRGARSIQPSRTLPRSLAPATWPGRRARGPRWTGSARAPGPRAAARPAGAARCTPRRARRPRCSPPRSADRSCQGSPSW